MVNVAEPAERTASTRRAAESAPGRRSAASEIRGGWAGELALAGETVWTAWAGHQTREAEFAAEGDREWRMLPGATLDGWRAALRETSFTISLARLDGTAPADARELARSPF